MAESEKNRKLIDEMNKHQRRIQQLEVEIHELRSAPKPVVEDMSHLQRDVSNLTRELEILRTRYVTLS